MWNWIQLLQDTTLSPAAAVSSSSVTLVPVMTEMDPSSRCSGLLSVGTQCCQDCQGKIYPPNRVVSTTNLEDRCDTVEQAVCKTVLDEAGSTIGTIEVSYTAGNCCLDDATWSPAGSTILEKDTCSARTCHQGRPAQWYRDTKYQGGCGCCEYQSALQLPGDCVTLGDGREACCCDGDMVVTVTGVPVPAQEVEGVLTMQSLG